MKTTLRCLLFLVSSLGLVAQVNMANAPIVLSGSSSGGGSGTVGSGTATQFAYYPSTGPAVSSTPTATVSSAGRLTFAPSGIASGTTPYITVTGVTDTGLTAGASLSGVDFTPSNRTHAGNSQVGSMREFLFEAPTYSFAAATGNIINAATVTVSDAPVLGLNVTITNPFALWLSGGSLGMGDGIADNHLAILSQSNGLPNLTGEGGIQLTPSRNGANGIVSIAGSAADLVMSDSPATRSWVATGAASIGRGIYVQRSGLANLALLSATTGPISSVSQSLATGSITAIGATSTAASARWAMNTFGGSTWVTPTSMFFVTTQAQTESARGAKIEFRTTPNSTTTSAIQLTIDQDGSVKASNATGGLGYGAGAGGAVTQGSSRTTTVVLNTVTGAVTLFTAAGAATWTTFTVTNSAVAATDTVTVCSKTGTTDTYVAVANTIAAGSFKISFMDITGTTSEAPVLNYTITRGSAN